MTLVLGSLARNHREPSCRTLRVTAPGSRLRGLCRLICMSNLDQSESLGRAAGGGGGGGMEVEDQALKALYVHLQVVVEVDIPLAVALVWQLSAVAVCDRPSGRLRSRQVAPQPVQRHVSLLRRRGCWRP
eukprot:8163376-Pyramimonas_sp.AAC.1